MPRGPRPQYDSTHRRAAAALVTEHRRMVGDWCPGLAEAGIDAHAASALVADHDVAGHPEQGYTVRCVRCNSRRRALGIG